MRELPQQAVEIAKRFEGFNRIVKGSVPVSAAPYLCPAGFWTIGYGHLCDRMHPEVTRAEAALLLMHDMEVALAQALRLCPRLAVESDAKLAAIVDFTFNLGSGRLKASTLRKRVNAGDWTGAASEIKKWVWGGGRKLPGLVLRREVNAAMLLN